MAGILIVEAEQPVVETIQNALVKAGHIILGSVASGVEAIHAARQTQPDLVLVDVHLQKQFDGVEAATQIYDDLAIPIVYLAASVDSAALRHAEEPTAFGYVIKPCREEALQRTIQTALHRHQVEHHLTTQLRQAIDLMQMTTELTQAVHLNETELLQRAVLRLQRITAAHYVWGSRYSQQQSLATIICDASAPDHSLPSSVGRQIWLDRFPQFYLSLFQGQVWHNPMPEVLPLPYQSLAAPGYTCLICPLSAAPDDLNTAGDIGLLLPAELEPEQVELIAQTVRQLAAILHRSAAGQSDQTDDRVLLEHLRDDFISSVSHELRTPLSNMRVALEMLHHITQKLWALDEGRSLPSDDSVDRPLLWHKVGQYLQILQDEWQNEFNLVTDLLNFKRPTTLPAPLAAITLQQWLPQLVDRFTARVNQQQQTLTCYIDPNLPAIVSHAASLERILAELLNNACKHTPPRQSIRVVAQVEGNGCQIQVINTGITIPQGELKQIFSPFYRIPRITPWNHSGMGLGLALVQKLVAALGGHIQASSQDRVTAFTLTLPLNPTAPDQQP